LEIIAAVLLFFRNTTVLGAIMSIAMVLNILMLNIGYDVQVKTETVHLILIGVFILYPDTERLLKFFFLNKNIQPKHDTLTFDPNMSRAFSILKYVLICTVIFVYVNYYSKQFNRHHSVTAGSAFNGIYEINDFHIAGRDALIDKGNTKWTKMAIMNGYTTIRFGNDSSSVFFSTIDVKKNLLELKNPYDSLFKSSLVYYNNSAQYLFKGTFGDDSVFISARKIDMEKMPLNKDRGKIKWRWY
jgi:hypothetical protein